MTRTQAAFCLSVQHMFKTYGVVYFWTFTFPDVYADWIYPNAWAALVRKLGNLHGGLLGGLRVLEVHPGGHGLHYHALLNFRLPVDQVRKISKPYGFGIVQVSRARTVRDAYYLAKYLSKRSDLYKGMHRWGRVGSFQHVPKARVEVDSPFHRNMKLLGRGRQMPWEFASIVLTYSRAFGDFTDWPKKAVDGANRELQAWSVAGTTSARNKQNTTSQHEENHPSRNGAGPRCP